MNSIRHKFHEIKFILDSGYVDILALSETKLDDSDNDNLYNVNGFTLLRKDKRKSSGGLMMYISSRIPHRELQFTYKTTAHIEILPVELVIDQCDKWFLGLIYKNPSTSNTEFENFFKQVCTDCIKSHDDSILVGDLNFNMLNSTCPLGDLCDLYGLKNIIDTPTCFKSMTPTLIDVILVNDKKRFYNSFTADVGISDVHHLVGAAMRKHIPPAKTRVVEYRDVKNIDYYQVRIDLFNLSILDTICRVQKTLTKLFQNSMTTWYPFLTNMLRLNEK